MCGLMYNRWPKPIAMREANMRIPDEVRNSVEFLCIDGVDDNGQTCKVPRATCFYISYPVRHDLDTIYMVTARHIVDKIAGRGGVYVRFNTDDGGLDYEYIKHESFISHPTTDVAVSVRRARQGVKRIGLIPFSALITQDEINTHKVVEGDEVFIPSLFSEFSGRKSNQPIFRFGKVSLAAHERVNLKLSPFSDSTSPVDAYLVESLSWGGESGSPVFVRLDRLQNSNDKDPEFRLLGIVHGHYQVMQEIEDNNIRIGKVDLNSGIMAVIPTQAILELLGNEEFVAQRKLTLELYEKSLPAPVPD